MNLAPPHSTDKRLSPEDEVILPVLFLRSGATCQFGERGLHSEEPKWLDYESNDPILRTEL